MSPPFRSPLVARYQIRLDSLAKRLGVTAQQAWDALGSYDEADIERLAEQLSGPAQVARGAAASLSAALVAALAGVNLGLPKLGSVDWSPAFTLTWKALGERVPWDQAVAMGGRAIEGVGFDAVQEAARETAQHADRSERITAWAREPDASACDWCLTVAEQLYRSADSADFGHDRCGCAVVPA